MEHPRYRIRFRPPIGNGGSEIYAWCGNLEMSEKMADTVIRNPEIDIVWIVDTQMQNAILYVTANDQCAVCGLIP